MSSQVPTLNGTGSGITTENHFYRTVYNSANTISSLAIIGISGLRGGRACAFSVALGALAVRITKIHPPEVVSIGAGLFAGYFLGPKAIIPAASRTLTLALSDRMLAYGVRRIVAKQTKNVFPIDKIN